MDEQLPEEMETHVPLSERLRGFFEKNSFSHLAEEAGGDVAFIENPWADDTVRIRVSRKDSDNVFRALSRAYLPPRLSAVMFSDTNLIEIIFTAYKMSTDAQVILTREFTMCLHEHNLKCYFAPMSPDAFLIASRCFPKTSASDTLFRNTQSFVLYANRARLDDDYAVEFGEPYSFFIEGAPLHDEDGLLHVLRHVNFQMQYHDADTPYIQFHERDPAPAIVGNFRYITGSFPTQIQCTTVDDAILALWDGALKTNGITAYNTLYRILEYCSYQYAEEKLHRRLRQILRTPSAFGQVDETIRKIMGSIHLETDSKSNDFSRNLKLIESSVARDKIGTILDAYKDYFLTEQTFDGGLRVDRLLKKAQESSSEQFPIKLCMENYEKFETPFHIAKTQVRTA